MIVKVRLVCTAALLAYGSSLCASPISECSTAIRMSREQYHNNVTLALSHATLLENRSSDDTSVAAALQSLSPEGFVDATGAFNRSKVNELRQESAFRFDGRQSEGYFAYYLSQISADAFNRCVDTAMQRGGVHIWPVYVDHRIARLAIRRVTPLGARDPFVVELLLNGQVGPNARRLSYGRLGSGEQVIEIRRRPNQPLVISAAYHGTTDNLDIPPYVRVERTREDSPLRNSSNQEVSIRGGWDLPTSMFTSWVNLQPDPPWRIDVATLVPVHTRQYDERGPFHADNRIHFAGLNGADAPSEAGFSYRAHANCTATESSCYVAGYAQWREWRWVYTTTDRPDWAVRH